MCVGDLVSASGHPRTRIRSWCGIGFKALVLGSRGGCRVAGCTFGPGFSIGAGSAASRQAGKVLWLQSKAHDHRRRKDIWINVYVHCNKHIWLGSGLYFNLSVFASKRSHRKKVQASYNSPVIYIATKTKIRKN